jgi:hypothetical protein
MGYAVGLRQGVRPGGAQGVKLAGATHGPTFPAIDLCEKMIGLARASEAQQRQGIDYTVRDGRDFGVAAAYHLAVAAHLLNYAHDRAELNAMCSGIARCMKPGARFVTVNSNPARDLPRRRPIGRWRRTTSGEVGGTPSVASGVTPSLAGKCRMGLCSPGEG